LIRTFVKSFNPMKFSFGEQVEGIAYKVLDERIMRASAGLIFAFGLMASFNGFILHRFEMISYIMGGFVLNFIIGLFINPAYAPTVVIGRMLVKNQTPFYIGAIQKKFAWALGFTLSSTIFILSLFLQADPSLFGIVCMLCVLCLTMLFLETAFAICTGCELYKVALSMKLLKKPAVGEEPLCMGGSCSIDDNDTKND